MRKVFYFILAFAIILPSCNTTNSVKFTVENPLDFDRTEELVTIDLQSLKLSASKTNWIVKNEAGEIILSQLTSDHKIVFQSGLKANQIAFFILEKGKSSTDLSSKVFGRVYPERKEDFAWENDKVGFRFYGNELKQFDGPSNGLDLWFKRTHKLILDEWYRKSVEEGISYHVDHGEGCDPYGVGHSLGAGAMAPYIDEELILNDNYLTAEIIDNGPLRFTAKLHYPPLAMGEAMVEEVRTVSLDAGSQLTKIEQYYGVDKEIQVAAGIVKRKSDDSVSWTAGSDYFVYEEPATEVNGQIFVGVLIPQGIYDVQIHSYEYLHPIHKKIQNFTHVNAYTTYRPSNPLVYYTGFGWNKFGFESLESFEAYMAQFDASLKNPFIVRFK